MDTKLLQKQVEVTLELTKLLDRYRHTLEHILMIAQQGTHEEIYSEVDAQASALVSIVNIVKETLKGDSNETLKFAHYPYSLAHPYPVAEYYTGDGSRLSSDSGESASGAGPADHE